MAYAGTPTGLAQQAGASRPWKTVLAAIAVLAIGLALVIAVMFMNSRAVAPATGRDDGLIEAQRDATLLAGANSKIFVSEDKPQHLAPAVGGTSSFGTEGAAAAAARAGVPAVPAVHDREPTTPAGVRATSPRWATSGSRSTGSDRLEDANRGPDDVRSSFLFRPQRRRHRVKGPVARGLTK